MKKHNFVTGIVFTLAGIVFFLAALFSHGELDAPLCGVAGGLLGSGVIILYKYFYAKAHRQDKEFQEKQEREDIELHDELKEKIRNQSGRYAYILGIVVAAVAYLVFSTLDSLHVLETGSAVLIFLALFVLFQIVAGVVIFKVLLNKYE